MKICGKCNVKFDTRICVIRKKASDAKRYLLKKEIIDARNTAYYANNKDKVAIAEREYRAANKEKIKDRAAKYYLENTERISKIGAIYREANKDNRAAAAAARYAENPEKYRAINAVWMAANIGRKLASNKAWVAANAERNKANIARWSAENPQLRRISVQNRRAKKRLAGGRLSKGLSAKLFKLQRGKCACCSLPLGSDYHLDHRMPIALGGSNTDDNMQLLRKLCNLQKSAKHPVDFMQSRGFLL